MLKAGEIPDGKGRIASTRSAKPTVEDEDEGDKDDDGEKKEAGGEAVGGMPPGRVE